MKTLLTLWISSTLFLAAAWAFTPLPQERNSAPGKGQEYLQKYVGNFEVTKSFFPVNGEPRVVKGTCRQTMIQNGRFLQSDFVFGEGEAKTTGTGVIGFEPETGVFTSFWIDSRQTAISVRRSYEPFDNQKVTLKSHSLGDPGKETRKSRTVSRLEDEGKRIVHRQYGLNAEGDERLTMELVLVRVADESK